MVSVGSGVRLEDSPPVPSMDEARRELDAAVLQAKKLCIDHATQQESQENAQVKRYLYAVTVARKDRFYSLHSGRRSRSLTRVYVEERVDRAHSAHPALPKKSDFAEEDIEEGTIRLEWHETIEGRKADIAEDDKEAVKELEQQLPADYHQWQHDVQVHAEETSASTTSTIWKIGDHLFSYEEAFDLSVDLPDKVYYFFNGHHLPEKRRRYNSLPNLTSSDLYDSSVLTRQVDHSHHSLYGHGFRHIGSTFLSRTMESLDQSRLDMGARPSLQSVTQDEEGNYSVSSSSLYYRIPITVFEKGSRRSLHEVQLKQSHKTETSTYEEHYAAPSNVSTVDTFETESHHYAEPEIHLNESTVVAPPSPEHVHSASTFGEVFRAKLVQVGEAVKDAVEHVHHQEEETIYDHVYEEPIYDEVSRDSPPPIPLSPQPTRDEDLHYAAVAIATDDESHLYKDDEHIYEDIDAHHVIESSAYAEPHIYETPTDTAAHVTNIAVEHEYAEVAKDHHIAERVVTSVSHFSSLRNKFESHYDDAHYDKITAPRRKDYDFDENANHEEILVRTPEFSESERVALREVKPYVGSPTFNKLQKKFFPEDLAAREAQWEKGDVVDTSVLNSPTTVITNNGIAETEYRAYDKNTYDDAATLVMASPVDQQTAKTTLAIRRMSRNNQWSEGELESSTPKHSHLEEYIPPNSPFVKVSSPLACPSPRSPSISPIPPKAPVSPLASPRSPAVSPVPPKSPEPEIIYHRPVELHLNVGYDATGRSPVSPVERVVSSEIKSPHSPVELYQSGFVAERRKLFERGAAPPLPGYIPAKKAESRSYVRTAATVRLEPISPVQRSQPQPTEVVHEPVVQLRKTQIGEGAVVVETKNEDTSNRRKSVLEMRREYEASMQGSQPPSGTTSPQRSRTNSRRRTAEVQIGGGVALTPSPPKNAAGEESSLARRTVHRTLEKAMHKEPLSVSAHIGQGVQVSIDRSPESHSASATISIGSTSPIPAVRVGAGAVPSSAAPPPPVAAPVASSISVDFPVLQAKPIEPEEVRESTAAVEEEPTPLQRNGSGRRSWTVKTYEHNIRFDNQKLKIMPDVDYATANGHLPNGIEKMNGEENAVLRDWDPRPLVRALYQVSYEPRLETKRNRFFTMEGHVEVPSQETNTLAELEREWKSQYMRAKEGRLQIFASHGAEDTPAEEIVLSGCDIDANREERTLVIHGGKDRIRILLRVPSAVFDKWRQALLSHAASSQIDAYVKPVLRTLDHLNERVVIIEIGSCSIRGGRLTQEPSLPQSFFPAFGVRTDDGKIIVGEDAFTPEVRHRGEFVRPIQASDPAVERYTMNKEVIKACMDKVVSDLNIDPTKYKVLLSIPQNIPIVLISELLAVALQNIRFQGAAITRQPSLILYAYDVTTGVVVDIGDRLNIVPVIDGYVVDSAICSIPYGATQIREALRKDLCAHNKGLYSFQSPIEKLILRYAMEQISHQNACYVPDDYAKEEKSGVRDVHVSLDEFDPTPQMPTRFNIDSSRFTCTEGLFRPKKWGLDTKGLHQLVHEAVQMSPIDSRRNLYRNIFLAGGASLLPGLAEKLEQELANIVPNTIHTQVHISPWRYNAAYLGAQVVASSSTFEDKCVTGENLQKFLFNLSTSTF